MKLLRPAIVPLAALMPIACGNGGTGSGGIAPAATTQLASRAGLGGTTPVVYSTPLTITAGGTYQGNWQGTSTTPAVSVKTTSAVTIKNCNVTGPGTLITGTTGMNVTVEQCTGTGLTTGATGSAPGHFLSASDPGSVIVEHNLLTNTGGMAFYGPGTGSLSAVIHVLYNSVANVDGLPDGGGSCTENGVQPYCHRNFVELHDIFADPNIAIAWNQVLNTPDKSAMEDVILVDYASGVSAAQPIAIHDNYMGGAYNSAPETAMAYTGSGINAADGGTAADANHVTAFVHVYNNQVVNFENYGIGVSAGHDNQVYNNRIVDSNVLSGGAQIGKAWTGLIVHNAYRQSSSIYFNNTATGNVVGDTYVGMYGLTAIDCDAGNGPKACSVAFPNTGNTDLKSQSPVVAVTTLDEAAEFTSWQAKLFKAGAVVGPAP